MGSAAPYVELHCHSAYSFLDGASSPTELAEQAARLGYQALALTDHDGLWGSMEFAKACEELPLRPITGAELSVAWPGAADGATELRHLTLLVENAQGYSNLCRLLTQAHAGTREGTGRIQAPPQVSLDHLESNAKGLICLTGCARDGLIAGCWGRGETASAEPTARRLRSIFGAENLRVELQRPYWRHDRARNRWLTALAQQLGLATVATGNVHAHERDRVRLQDAFVAIHHGVSLEAAEEWRRGNSSSALARPEAMAARFGEHPEAVAETTALAERLRFDLTADLGYTYPGSEDGEADRNLARLCRARLAERYPKPSQNREATKRLDYELKVIGGLGLAGLFLLHQPPRSTRPLRLAISPRLSSDDTPQPTKMATKQDKTPDFTLPDYVKFFSAGALAATLTHGVGSSRPQLMSSPRKLTAHARRPPRQSTSSRRASRSTTRSRATT